MNTIVRIDINPVQLLCAEMLAGCFSSPLSSLVQVSTYALLFLLMSTNVT